MGREVLQGQLVFLRAAFRLPAMRDVLHQHRVQLARAGFEVRDREFDVAAFVIATQHLCRTTVGGRVDFEGGASETGVSKIVATSRRRSSLSDAPTSRWAWGFASSTRRETGSKSMMPDAARSKIAR